MAEPELLLMDVLGDIRDQDAGTLSGGQRRLLELARTLMVESAVMLLDEPSIGLESRFIDDVFERIEQLNDLGTTILLVEQNAQEGLSVADRDIAVELAEARHPPADGILELAAEFDVDHVAMGSRKRSPAGKVVFGSVAQQVLLEADVPVTVVARDG